MTEPRSGPYIWVTWLSKLLVGDRSCEWATWFKAHHKNYDRSPSPFDVVTWQMNHTALLNDVRAGLELDGNRVLSEDQNYFNLRGNSGAVLGGKPDLVIMREDGAGVIYDIKTGQPRASDTAQVMIYMYALPYVNQFRGIQFDGRLVYKEGSEVEIPADAIDDSFRSHLFGLIRRISDSEPARKVPSALECSMCDLTLADCPEMIEGDPRSAISEGAEF